MPYRTPAGAAERAARVRDPFAGYRDRAAPGGVPVTAVTRLFPLLAGRPAPPPPEARRGG
ncbi:hypothetical protein RM844_27930 [Streptomyces sp. DSM 44915]|uniref:Uncharacterized protein n=1 Tax=Streptomyces chisholmiae TaxID=3075540 RepID=A0ABU2K001_9ACTN|nr:hypothetical protein [Streptomyces sp. DSM 44915]MDT0270109.1 hypothetical protein [Streptomyces sp. DSM 44915]